MPRQLPTGLRGFFYAHTKTSPMLRLKNLGSGSAGNATLIEGSDGLRTRRLLVDCGLGVRQLAARLDQAGLAWPGVTLRPSSSPTSTQITLAARGLSH